jgi:hypothetical protein
MHVCSTTAHSAYLGQPTLRYMTQSVWLILHPIYLEAMPYVIAQRRTSDMVLQTPGLIDV